MTTEQKEQVIESLRFLIADSHTNSIAHGFYKDESAITECLEENKTDVGELGVCRHDTNMALTRLALITSEIGEAVDAVRHGNPPSDHIPEYDGLSEELADVLIRCFDLAGYLKLPLAEATIAKMAFNESRPFMHGKNS